jgi:hypothetical protein
MNIDFPDTPITGQKFTDQNSAVWTWNNGRWRRDMPSVIPGIPNFYTVSTSILNAATPGVVIPPLKKLIDVFGAKLTASLAPAPAAEAMVYYVGKDAAAGADNSAAGVWRYTADNTIVPPTFSWLHVFDYSGGEGVLKAPDLTALNLVLSTVADGTIGETLDDHRLWIKQVMAPAVTTVVAAPGVAAVVGSAEVSRWLSLGTEYQSVPDIVTRNNLQSSIGVGHQVYVQATDTVYAWMGNSLPGADLTATVFGWVIVATFPSLTLGHRMRWVFDPEMPLATAAHWEDDRDGLAVVNGDTELSDRTLLPLSHIALGKLVFVKSDGFIYELIHDTAHMVGDITDWKQVGQGGVKYAGRMMNLPDPKTGRRPANGQLYVVEMDFSGNPYRRLVSWDESITGDPQKVKVTPINFVVPNSIIRNPTQMDTFIGVGATPAGGAGATLVVENPLGITGSALSVFPGIHFVDGTRFVYLGNPLYGTQGFMALAPEAGWVDAATTPPTLIPPVTVDDRSVGPQTGGWRFLNRHSWVKPTVAASDHIMDNRQGDFQSTTENAKKVLKVFDGAAWITLFDEEAIKGWIASLALFRGTASEDDTTHIGTIQVDTLPDLAALSAALDGSSTGEYWVWQGAAPYPVVAVTPRIGTDLTGVNLNVGDWLSIANRGTPAAPDLHYVRIGGDLLTAARGHGLFGLHTWVDGTYEKGSLVNSGGDIYRAKTAVIAGASSPTAHAAANVPTAGVAKPLTNIMGSVVTDLITWAKLLIADPVPITDWVAIPVLITGSTTRMGDGTVGAWNGFTVRDGGAFVWTGATGLENVDPAFTIHKGWLYVPPTGLVGNAVTLTGTQIATLTAGFPVNSWEKVPVGGGIKWVPDDAHIPLVGNIGDVYLIVSSAQNSGKPYIVTWDAGANKWVEAASSGNAIPLVLTGGDLIYPKNYLLDSVTADPAAMGMYEGDLELKQAVANGLYSPRNTFDKASAKHRLGVNVPLGTTGGNIRTGLPFTGAKGDLAMSPKDVNHKAQLWHHDGSDWVGEYDTGLGIIHRAERHDHGYAWNDAARGWVDYSIPEFHVRTNSGGASARWYRITVTLAFKADGLNTRAMFRCGIGAGRWNIEEVLVNHDYTSIRQHTWTFVQTLAVNTIHAQIGYKWVSGSAIQPQEAVVTVEDIGMM